MQADLRGLKRRIEVDQWLLLTAADVRRYEANDRVADIPALQDEMLVCYFSSVLELSGKLYDEATKGWELWHLTTEFRYGFQASRAWIERRLSNDPFS